MKKTFACFSTGKYVRRFPSGQVSIKISLLQNSELYKVSEIFVENSLG